ncbi:MAG TPA: hypothetical protein PKI60_00510 [Oscillospiraceae bacterium]|nr:hypothetical protein [Oscillospiraceae bacterium]
MKILISAQEINNQLHKIVQYFIFDDTIKLRIDNIISKISDTENVDRYAQKYEKETDAFIYKISELMKLERKDTLAEISKISDQVLMAFAIRLFTIDEMLLKNPDKLLPISDDNITFLCDCLIKYWRVYQEDGDVNILNA